MSIYTKFLVIILTAVFLAGNIAGSAFAADNNNLSILRNGLVGAATGALSAELSGGKAGKGALIGAGVNVIGGALLDFLTGSSRPQAPVYAQPAPYYPQPVYQQPVQTVYVQQPVYIDRPVYVRRPQPQPVYYSYAPPQEDPNRRILRQGLLGAGVGAIAAGASGGKVGQGALIGAGTNVIGGALLDVLTSN